jgi:hypothetical protein
LGADFSRKAQDAAARVVVELGSNNFLSVAAYMADFQVGWQYESNPDRLNQPWNLNRFAIAVCQIKSFISNTQSAFLNQP